MNVIIWSGSDIPYLEFKYKRSTYKHTIETFYFYLLTEGLIQEDQEDLDCRTYL